MSRQKSRDTKPEMQLRQALHKRGMRYWVHRRPLPGVRRTCDVVFPRLKIAVEVRGCFWHGCELHRSIPSNNREWWTEKITGNRKRDQETEEILRSSGWEVVVVWEHDDIEEAAVYISNLVDRARRYLHSG